MELFLGRAEEQERFRAVLAELVRGGSPDEGYVVLVHGLGGIGKSTLLGRYQEIAADGVPGDRPRVEQKFLTGVVDWENEQRRRPADYVSAGGPPIWVVLDAVYEAVRDAAAASRRDSTAVDRAFAPFRVQVTKVPELAEEVRRVLPGGENERQTSAADIEAVLQAVGRGAALLSGADPLGVVAAGPTAKSAVHLANDAREAVRERRQGRVPEEVYRLLLRRIEALVDTFAQCLRQVSEKVRPVVLVLDTCELILGSQEYLRRAMRRGGSRVVWVIGIRLEPEVVSGVGGEAALYRRTLAEARLRTVAVDRFSDRTVGEYLDLRLPSGLPSGVSVDRVAEVTRGIPLAVSLVCDLLARGQNPEVALRPVPKPGRPSVVIRELASRYMTHVLHCAPLRADLPLLYGLALLRIDRLDPALLAALWNVDPTEVADLTVGLAARHDFVLRDSRRLHDDVAVTILLHLLDDALRAEVRPMNHRAAAHLRNRLDTLGYASIDDQVTSEEWQGLVTALLCHTFWVDTAAGIWLLCDVLPAADIIAQPFAVAMLNVAAFFVPILNSEQSLTVTALRALLLLPSQWLASSREESADPRQGLIVLGVC